MRKSHRRKHLGTNPEAYVYLIPWFVGVIVLGFYPLLSSLFYSFTNFNLLNAPSFIGLKNYKSMVSDSFFWQSVIVTLKYVLFGVPLSLLVAFIVALVLVNPFPGVSFLRTIFYLPSLLGSSVAIAVLWRLVFSTNGVINQLLLNYGIVGESWIGDPRYALGTLVLLRMWQFGSSMLIFVAGMKQIPKELYESADIEGAGYFSKLFFITMPMLSSIILFNGIMTMISAFQDFTPAYIISGGTGSPMNSTLFYSLYLYQKAFGSFQMGYATAMALILMLMMITVTIFIFWIGGRHSYYEK